MNKFLIENRYELIIEISVSLQSKIYKAYDLKTKKKVIIKFIHTQNEIELKKALNEVNILQKLKHKGIVKFLNITHFHNMFGIVFEYLSGITLKNELNFVNNIWSFVEIYILFNNIFDVVKFIHKNNIIHNDIKPENIMVNSIFDIKFIDFGISKKLSFGVEKCICSSVFGTPKYLAPEIIKKRECSFQSDIYSLGVLLYEVIVGVAPFEDENKYKLIRMHVEEKPIKPSEINSLIEKPLNAIIYKALEKNIKKRYKSVSELQKDFNNYFKNKYNYL